MNRSQVSTISVLLFFVKFTNGLYTNVFDGVSFLSKSDLKRFNQVGDAIFDELEWFHDQVIEKLAGRLESVFNKHGLKKDEGVKLLQLLTVPENTPSGEVAVRTRGQKFKDGLLKFLKGLKGVAQTSGKAILERGTKIAFKSGLIESMPYIEGAVKRSLEKLPVKIRVIAASLFYPFFATLFKKLKIKAPEKFTLEYLAFDGLSEEKRKVGQAVLSRIRSIE